MLNVNDLFCPFQIIHIKLKSGKKHTDDECGTTETTKWIKAVRVISEEQEGKKREKHGDEGGHKKKRNNQVSKRLKKTFFFQGLKPLNVSGILTSALNSIFTFVKWNCSFTFYFISNTKNRTLRNENPSISYLQIPRKSATMQQKFCQSGLQSQNQEMWNLHINS